MSILSTIDRPHPSAKGEPPVEVIDVFVLADGSGGNALGLVTDNRARSSHEMQSLANTLGYSETILLSEVDAAVTARIFTPGVEVPFAGHPLVGACWHYGRAGRQRQFPIATPAGLVLCSFDPATQIARVRAPQSLSTVAAPTADALARALTLEPAAVVSAPIGLSIGLPFVAIELRTRDELRTVGVDVDRFRAAIEPTGADAVLCWTRANGRDHDIDARMFSPLDGIGEDPATGSACGALAAYLAGGRQRPFSIRVRQGEDMGRPCEIFAEVAPNGHVFVSGRCALAVADRNALFSEA